MMVRRKPQWNRLSSGLYVPPLLGLGNPWPCPGCCQGCEYFSDDFDRSDDTDLGADWTEVAGAWEIASNVLSTTSDDAICKCETDGVLSYVVRAVLKGGIANDEFRILFNYTDDNNYSYARVERTFTTQVKVHLVSVSGGVHTVLKSSAGFNHNLSTESLGVQVCVHSDSAYVSTAVGGFGALTARTSTAMETTTGTCGVGTGTNSVTAVTFDLFSIQKHAVDLAGCPKCEGACNVCLDDLVAERYQVVISGVVGLEDCADSNGTWILSGHTCKFSTGTLNFDVASACIAGSQIIMRFQQFDHGLCDSPADYYQVAVLIAPDEATTICVDNCRATFVASQATEYDCDDLVNLSLTPGAAPQYCDPSSATCIVTAL